MSANSYDVINKSTNSLGAQMEAVDGNDKQISQLTNGNEKNGKDPKAGPSFAAQVLGAIFGFMGQLIVSLNTLAVKLNPKVNASWFLMGQG